MKADEIAGSSSIMAARRRTEKTRDVVAHRIARRLLRQIVRLAKRGHNSIEFYSWGAQEVLISEYGYTCANWRTSGTDRPMDQPGVSW